MPKQNVHDMDENGGVHPITSKQGSAKARTAIRGTAKNQKAKAIFQPLSPTPSNNAKGQEKQPSPKDVDPQTANARDVFWQDPIPVDKQGRVIGWYSPPAGGDVPDRVEDLAKKVEAKGHPLQGALLLLLQACATKSLKELFKATQSGADKLQRKNECIRQENAEQKKDLQVARNSEKKAGEELRKCQREEAHKSAKAGAVGDSVKERRKNLTQPPSAQVLAAKNGVTYLSVPSTELRLLNRFGPLLLGPLLGMALIFAINLVSRGTIHRVFEQPLLFLLMMASGTGVLGFIGGLITMQIRIFGRYIHDREPREPSSKVRATLVPAILIAGFLMATFSLLSEAGVEMYFMSIAEADRIIELKRALGASATPTQLQTSPFLLRLLVSSIITAPFVYFKMYFTYDAVQVEERANFATHLAYEWTHARLKEVEVMEALEAGTKVLLAKAELEKCQKEVARLKSKRQKLVEETDGHSKRRIDAAREAACGEASTLYQRCLWLVDSLDPLKAPLEAQVDERRIPSDGWNIPLTVLLASIVAIGLLMLSFWSWRTTGNTLFAITAAILSLVIVFVVAIVLGIRGKKDTAPPQTPFTTRRKLRRHL